MIQNHDIEATQIVEHETQIRALKRRRYLNGSWRSLTDVYDADLRITDPLTTELVAKVTIPHPLLDVEYADGVYSCPHKPRCWNKRACIERYTADG